MSDLHANISPSGFVGLEAEKATAAVVNQAQVDNPPVTAAKGQKLDNQNSVPTPAEMDEAVEDVNNVMQNMQRKLSFSVDKELGEPIILVTDTETDEVIRQIPSEELVVLRKKLDDVVGILFDSQV